MDNKEREHLEAYLAEITAIADKADELRSRVDPQYGELLQKEADGYRELIAIWRKRLASGS